MNRNRDKGHRFEVEIMNKFKELGFDCTTSRYSSREMDDKKIDHCGTGPFASQCKHVQNLGPAHKVLKEMDAKSDAWKVLFHKRTREGVVVSMELGDWMEMVAAMIREGIIKVPGKE